MRARGKSHGDGPGGVLVSRTLAPMAAVPVAALVGVVCAFAVLARDDGRARRGRPATTPPTPTVSAPRASAPIPTPAPVEVAVELAPPPSAASARATRADPAPAHAGDAGTDAGREDGPGALERALTVMLDPLRPWPERLEAASTLGRAHAIDLLLGATASADEDVRGLAVTGLDLLVATGPADEALLTALLRMVDDVAPDVAGRAAGALARLPEGRRSIVSRLRGGDAPGLVHIACAEALRERGTPDEVPALLGWATVEGPVGEVAAAAVRAICARAGIESPLPPPEPPGEARPSRD